MGQRRLATPQKDDANKRPQSKKSNNAVLNSTTTRKGEVFELSDEQVRMLISGLHST